MTGTMEIDFRAGEPKISVIITCYNQARFLRDSIESVLQQTHRNIDLIVVDDGSSDDTQAVAQSFSNVRYIHQSNGGLSAARNRGIDESKGAYLVFLDADDLLYPEAVETNFSFLLKNPAWAFVSGWHDKVDEWGYPFEEQEEQQCVAENHYRQLLKGNYIGMHATVMYQRWAFKDFRFDTSLKACEDYDIYFKIARQHPVGCHQQKIAGYRIHGKNMSSNIVLMYNHVLKICYRQWPVLKSNHEKAAYRSGLTIWGDYYSQKLHTLLWNDLEKTTAWPSSEELTILAIEKPRKFVDYLIKKSRFVGRKWLKKTLPDQALKVLHQKGFFKEYTPAQGKVNPGDFDRITPFSYDFGFDRGGAIDRFYIEKFITENRNYVSGNVLEIGDNEYTLKFGREAVKQSDILHIDRTNPKATFVGDITNVPQIPSGYFDCIIFTQTLHLIYDFKSALQTCYRILKPGGCLLLTVPGISHIDRGAWKDYWLWSFTDNAMRKLMRDTFNGSAIDIRTYGNVYVAAAFLYGMGLPEFREDSLLYNDPSYQVIISVKAVKP